MSGIQSHSEPSLQDGNHIGRHKDLKTNPIFHSPMSKKRYCFEKNCSDHFQFTQSLISTSEIRKFKMADKDKVNTQAQKTNPSLPLTNIWLLLKFEEIRQTIIQLLLIQRLKTSNSRWSLRPCLSSHEPKHQSKPSSHQNCFSLKRIGQIIIHLLLRQGLKD